ncbi:MAG TPA: CRISPR-associated endonuclease Cas1 [Rhizomicrobium sp.]|jgi:CRISPR-associated endonuclease Cas1
MTKEILYDLMESGLVVAPIKHGRKRNWSSREYRRLLEIVRLNSKGIEIHGEIRVLLWLKGCPDISIDFGERRNREIIARNFRRIINEMFRGIHSTYPEVSNPGPNGWPAQSVVRKMGELDATLAPVVNYRPEELLASYRVLKIGSNSEAKILERPLAQILDWLTQLPNMARSRAAKLQSQGLEAMLSVLAGALPREGDKESAAERAISFATADQYEMGRRHLQFLTRMFRYFGLRKVARSLLEPKWRVGMFVLLLYADFRAAKFRWFWLAPEPGGNGYYRSRIIRHFNRLTRNMLQCRLCYEGLPILRDKTGNAQCGVEWADRAEFWRSYQPPRIKPGPRKKFSHREPLILCGHGIRIRVDHSTLLVRSGLTHYPQKAEEYRYFPGEANLPDRIIVLDGSGGTSFDAMRWMSEQKIELIQLDWTGQVTSMASSSSHSADSKLVEAQRIAKANSTNSKIANWLIEEKLKASLLTLSASIPDSEVRKNSIYRIKARISEIRNSKTPISIPALLGIEGDSARAYFSAWHGIPIRWKGVRKKPIPSDWTTLGSRMMTWRKRARLARHPFNAMLNYGYGILAHRLRSQTAAAGLDANVGVIHGNSENPIPLVYDMMEPWRPVVDGIVLKFSLGQTFSPGDFAINEQGGCRLNPNIAKILVDLTSDIDPSSTVRAYLSLLR